MIVGCICPCWMNDLREHAHWLNSARLHRRFGTICSKPSAHHTVIVIDTADEQCLDYRLESYAVYWIRCLLPNVIGLGKKTTVDQVLATKKHCSSFQIQRHLTLTLLESKLKHEFWDVYKLHYNYDLLLILIAFCIHRRTSNLITWYTVFEARFTVTCNCSNASSTRMPLTNAATRFTFLGLWNKKGKMFTRPAKVYN